MDIFSVFTLLGGLAFFLYGMKQMSEGLEKVAGGRMEAIVEKMTSNRFSGLLLGCIITIAIQSSSAVTVMLVGLVNSGIMNIANTVGVIMGSNIGTTVTAWIMSLIGLSSDDILVRMLKPDSFSPVLAFIGVILMMVARSEKKKDVGGIFIGFAILMYGMILMSGSMSPLAESPSFSHLLTAFRNPLLGILVGLVVTAIIQSSAASIGMLQALAMTGGITYGMAIPIIMGQNIGTCATAILSSIGVSRNAKRVAVIHLSFNLIGTAFFITVFYILHGIIDFSFVDRTIHPVGIALCHSIFNIAATVLLLPFSKQLVKLAVRTVKTEEEAEVAFLDDRIFGTPAIAVSECQRLTMEMGQKTGNALTLAIENLHLFDEVKTKQVVETESEIDIYEDHLGSYLVRLSGDNLSERDRKKVAGMLRIIGNYERISDHARDLAESSRELEGKDRGLSDEAQRELGVLENAIEKIFSLACAAVNEQDLVSAGKVEPLEQVVDLLTEEIRGRHIQRLQRGECTIQNGFVLADILTGYERISDHCSNIAVAILEEHADRLDSHEYLGHIKSMEDPEVRRLFEEYKAQYSLS